MINALAGWLLLILATSLPANSMRVAQARAIPVVTFDSRFCQCRTQPHTTPGARL